MLVTIDPVLLILLAEVYVKVSCYEINLCLWWKDFSWCAFISHLSPWRVVGGSSREQELTFRSYVLVSTQCAKIFRPWLWQWRHIEAVLLEGPIGCGKTSLVEHLAAMTGREEAPQLLKVQLGDQTDSKVTKKWQILVGERALNICFKILFLLRNWNNWYSSNRHAIKPQVPIITL